MLIQIISHKTPLHGMLSTMQGGRPENQDDFGFLDTPLGFLLVVCDGMGGGPGGKLASYLAKSEVIRVVCSANEHSSRTETLKRAVSNANSLILKRMDDDMRLSGMGTTIVAVLINQKSALVVHLGDSRCYRTHNGQIVFRTKDHSLVGELVQNKVMSEEQARTSPQSNVITRALGATSNHVPEIEELSYKRGDRIVLCTDGVWGMFPHEVLKKYLVEKDDVASVVNRIAAKVDEIGFSQGGKHDNHTVAILEMDSFSLKKDRMTVKTQFAFSTLLVLLVVSVIFNLICYIKLGAQPQIKMLSELKFEVERLKPYESRYNSLVRNGDSELNRTVISLTKENEELKKRVYMLQKSLDSLRNEENHRSNLQKSIKEEHVEESYSGKATINNQQQRIKEDNLKAIYHKILCEFDELKNLKSNVSWRHASRKKNQVIESLIKDLQSFNDKSDKTFQPTVDAVIKQLNENEDLLKIAAKNEQGYFCSTSNAQKAIEKLKMKIDSLKSKLNF